MFVHGTGVISPAGWGIAPFRETLSAGTALPKKPLTRPGVPEPLQVRAVPPPSPRPQFLAHPRLRRTSPIAQYVVAAALEALGPDVAKVSSGEVSLGIVVCVMSACVNYSRRFYDEALKDPATASPLVFPETVFNAPSSHLAAFLGSRAINYTLVGDPATFVEGLALAAQWLVSNRVQACLVVGAEELDWLTAEAFHLFARDVVVADGAGAIYMGGDQGNRVQLSAVTDPALYTSRNGRVRAMEQVRKQITNSHDSGLLCDSLKGIPALDQAEEEAWAGWSGGRLSPAKVLGEGMMAGAAWQCVAAVDAIARGEHSSAIVSVAGTNQQAIAARFSA